MSECIFILTDANPNLDLTDSVNDLTRRRRTHTLFPGGDFLMVRVRVNDDEREALKQAALAAVPIVAKLRQQRAELDGRIASMEAILQAYEDVLGVRRTRPAGPGKMRRGQVMAHIDAVLGRGGDYTEPELRQAIFQNVSIAYSRPTIYSALRRGAKSGRYELKDDKRWRMRA